MTVNVRSRQLSALTAVAILLGISIAAAPGPRPLDVIKIRTSAFPNMAPIYLAEAEGYFAQQGLQLEHVDMVSGAAIVPAVVRGDVDVLPTVITPAVFNAITRGGRLRLVASQHQFGSGCSHSGFVVTRKLASSGALETAAGLRGKSHSVTTNLISLYMLETILKPFGLTPDDLRAVDVPESAALAALQAGRIDLALLGEPHLARALTEFDDVMWRSATTVLPKFQYAVFVYGSRLLDRQPDLGERFMTAYLRGVRQFLQGKTPRNLDLLEKPLGIDRALLTKMCWPPMTADARLNTDSLVQYEQWLLGRKLLDRVMAPAEMVDTRFIEFANRALAK